MWKESAFLCLLVSQVTLSYANILKDKDQLEKDEVIEAVNNAKTTWQAGRNFDPSLKSGYSKVLFGVIKDPNSISLPSPADWNADIDLPETFDAREKWRNCVGVQTVRDQGDCGSCWAVSSASVFTDRLCIASEGQFNSQLSTEDVLACGPGGGCNGGSPNMAFKYFETEGIVTGGDYNSHEGCLPYTIPNCDHHVKGKYKPCDPSEMPTPECRNTCSNKEYKKRSFKKDLHFIQDSSSFSISGDIKKIQAELYKNGPLVASFDVYDDFLSYKTGVYSHTVGEIKDGHAVKVIGWGVQNGTDYWLVANSWNEDWGEKGYFKIKRGTNECNFENDMVGGTPLVHQGYK